MKIKPATPSGGVIVELTRGETALPASPPLRIKRILVPVDFSGCSRKAVKYAVALARQFDAEILLLFVVQVNYLAGGEMGGVDFPLFEQEMREAGRRKLELLIADDIGGLAPVSASVRAGQPVGEIVAAAKDLDADVIVIATHGHTGLKHVLLGSTAENVVRHAPCPVLVVREQEHEFIAD
jgi:universal stress protein A